MNEQENQIVDISLSFQRNSVFFPFREDIFTMITERKSNSTSVQYPERVINFFKESNLTTLAKQIEHKIKIWRKILWQWNTLLATVLNEFSPGNFNWVLKIETFIK